MEDKRKQPRWIQHLRALFGGYFWLPCPICHQKFGGQEWGGDWYQGNGRGLGVCANCIEEAKRRSEIARKNDPPIQLI